MCMKNRKKKPGYADRAFAEAFRDFANEMMNRSSIESKPVEDEQNHEMMFPGRVALMLKKSKIKLDTGR